MVVITMTIIRHWQQIMQLKNMRVKMWKLIILLSFEIPLQERRVSLGWKPAKGVGDEKAECNL